MTKVKTPDIPKDWIDALHKEFQQNYFFQLKNFLLEEKKKHTVYPPGNLIFSAFNYTPLENVKVVIIGQDPYHGPDQANGLCFSVAPPVPPPPSLKNIFKELHNDLGCPVPDHGNLEKWAKQGVLLLNATLTVRHKSPGSHQNKGWEIFTDQVIKKVSENKSNVVFLLWGKYAQNKSVLIDASKHLILKSPHPSPFSVHNGFFGCAHFSKTNQYLEKYSKQAIDWCLD